MSYVLLAKIKTCSPEALFFFFKQILAGLNGTDKKFNLERLIRADLSDMKKKFQITKVNENVFNIFVVLQGLIKTLSKMPENTFNDVFLNDFIKVFELMLPFVDFIVVKIGETPKSLTNEQKIQFSCAFEELDKLICRGTLFLPKDEEKKLTDCIFTTLCFILSGGGNPSDISIEAISACMESDIIKDIRKQFVVSGGAMKEKMIQCLILEKYCKFHGYKIISPDFFNNLSKYWKNTGKLIKDMNDKTFLDEYSEYCEKNGDKVIVYEPYLLVFEKLGFETLQMDEK